MSFDKLRRAKAAAFRCRDAKSVNVLKALADEYREDTGECCPTIEELVASTGLSRSSVVRAIEHLEEDDLISIDRRFGARHYYTLHLDGQLQLKAAPQLVGRPREKRPTGFRVRPRTAKTHVRVTSVSERKSAPNRSQGEIGSDVEIDTNRSQPEIGNPCQGDMGSGATPSVHQDLPGRTATATASPRLPFPIAVKPPRPSEQLAKLAAEHRLKELRRRVAGHAVGLILKPERGVDLIQEPITSIETLVAATKEVCGKRGIQGYHLVLDDMCRSVWFRHSLYGKAVIAGKAPRPRALGPLGGPRR